MLFVAYLVFILINIVDFYFTRKIIEFGGKEFNFILRFIINRWGFRAVKFYKILFIVLVGQQVVRGSIDLFSLCYLSFVYTVVLILMYKDAKSVGLNLLTQE